MANIFDSLKPEAHLNHNIFDPSGRDVFSMKSAMIVPFSVIPTVPDSTYEIRSLNTIEIDGMPKANFGRFSQYQEFFFVPYSQLWKYFSTFYNQRLDPTRNPSNIRTPQLPLYVPTFDMKAFNYLLFGYYERQRFYLDFLDFLKAKEDAEVDVDYQGEPQTATSAIRSYLYSLNVGDFGSRSFLFNVHGELCAEDVMRNYDLLGYGNLLPRFKFAYAARFVYFYTDNAENVLPATFDSTDEDFQDYVAKYYPIIRDHIFAGLATRVLEALPTSTPQQLFNLVAVRWDEIVRSTFSTNFVHSVVEPKSNYHPNAWPIVAYCKIFSDYFRSTQYDDENYAYFCNLDWMTNPSPNDVEIDPYNILFCLQPRYHLYKRDLFTGLYPNSQFGDVAVATEEDNWKTLYVKTNSGGMTTLKAQTADVHDFSDELIGFVATDGVVQTTNDAVISSPIQAKLQSTISALAIRQTEAMQRYKEKILRAGNRLTNLQRAMFGDTSRYEEDNYVERIGAIDAPIQIDAVVATSDSSQSNLGDKGSKAFSVANDFVTKYTSHDFGLILGVMYILPEAEYEAFGMDAVNSFVQPFDYFKADFQNLGLSAVDSMLFNVFEDSKVLGYTSRYWQYKARVSKVHGEFSEGQTFTDYVTPRSANEVTSPRLSALYASPNDLDRIFYTSETPFQSSDHFKVNSNVTVKAVLPMSITGLPY